jgi:glycosyltransferase involved in cell wall biosynthesis
LISHNNGGYLIKPNDIDGFCEAINAVIRGEARNFGKYNKNIVKKFETNSVLEKLEGIYSKVCETLEV